jgi:endonuclease/exonuclease/phosphatase family metal-dependent hydrolase
MKGSVLLAPSHLLYQTIREQLRPLWPEFASFGSMTQLSRSELWRRTGVVVQGVLDSVLCVEGPRHSPEKRSPRVVAWNIERGKELDGQIETLRTHEYLKDADVLLLTELDVGMARSGNRDVPMEIAEALGMHAAFAPCYMSLVKGSGVERDSEGENELGLHGNAILSRYPIQNPRSVALANGIDKLASREKRLGRQTAVLAEIDYGAGPVTFASVHLDANSTQAHRAAQMRTVLEAIPPGAPAVIGGDWNTTTFNSSTAFHAICGFWLRVFMGPNRVIRNHYLHPYRRFERELFESLGRHGFDYDRSNIKGEYTIYYDVEDLRTFKGLAEWVPLWCFPFIRWSLRDHNGRCPLKIDWFATRGVGVQDPRVIHEVRECARPLSDHDAIGVDLPWD